MATLIKWKPVRDLMRINQNLNHYIDRFFKDYTEGSEGSQEGYCTMPPVESFRHNGSFVVKVDLPGIDPKDVHLTLEEHCLMIEGERRRAGQIDEQSLVEEEICYGPFRRSLHIPDGVKADEMKARYHDGVLEVTAPVEEKYLPKKIEVHVEKA